MSLIVEGGRDGNDWRAQCRKCGQTQWASEMVIPPSQAAGAPPKDGLICARHRVEHHIGNDLGELLQAFHDPEPVPIAQPTQTSSAVDPTAEPVVTARSPSSSSVAAFLAAPVVTLTGTGFSQNLPRSVVLWDGKEMPTTYVSATSIQATIPAAFITAGAHTVAVRNVGPPFKSGSWLDNDNDSDEMTVTLT